MQTRPLAILALLTAATTTGLDAQRVRNAPQFNQFGATVLDAAGQRRNYNETEMLTQRAKSGPALGDLNQPGIAKSATGILGDWSYLALGTGIGATGFSVSKGKDDKPEIIFGAGGLGFGGNRYWFIYRYDAATKTYASVFTSPPVEQNSELIRRLAVADLLPNAGPEIVLARASGEIEIWSQFERKRISSFASSQANLRGFVLADVDGDNTVEIVISTDSFGRDRKLFVYAPDGTVEWQSTGIGGTDVVVAQLDKDPALEIATTDGNVVDYGTKTVQWNWSTGFGFALEAADIDKDGVDELIGANAWTTIWAYDVDRQLPKWSLNNFNTGSIRTGDIDNDGQIELLVGDAQWGNETAYDAMTLTKEWAIRNPEHGTTDINFGDVDGDGKNEVIWGAGHTSSGKDIFYVGDYATQTREWESVHLDGPFRGPWMGDVDGDGKPEVVTITNDSNSGSGAGRILVFDGATMQLRAMSQGVARGLSWSGSHQVVLKNLDTDPALEIVVATSYIRDGEIEVYDYDGKETFTKVFSLPRPLPRGAFRSIDVVDIDGDSELEIVGASGQHVYAYSYPSGAQEWKSLIVAPVVQKIVVSDSDDDANLEIHALGSHGQVWVFDGKTKSLDAIIQGQHRTIYSHPMAPNQDLIILTDSNGTADCHLYVPGMRYVSLGGVKLQDGPMDNLQVILPSPWIFTASAGKLRLLSGTTPLMETRWYGAGFGSHVLMNAGRRMVLSAGAFGLVGFSF